ncbi:uncharacterized protein LOC116345566 [Contarinia nasturtii]|uniref:uncharacterized protein LOC116345566 n=1 Tax=Contarinia nasturtii TaxID=265458 RepID=UPI0012D420B1|nr:uncharacterized protein LOC116345566 [Contarinia nasturtii]
MANLSVDELMAMVGTLIRQSSKQKQNADTVRLPSLSLETESGMTSKVNIAPPAIIITAQSHPHNYGDNRQKNIEVNKLIVPKAQKQNADTVRSPSLSLPTKSGNTSEVNIAPQDIVKTAPSHPDNSKLSAPKLSTIFEQSDSYSFNDDDDDDNDDNDDDDDDDGTCPHCDKPHHDPQSNEAKKCETEIQNILNFQADSKIVKPNNWLEADLIEDFLKFIVFPQGYKKQFKVIAPSTLNIMVYFSMKGEIKKIKKGISKSHLHIVHSHNMHWVVFNRIVTKNHKFEINVYDSLYGINGNRKQWSVVDKKAMSTLYGKKYSI